MRLITSYRPTRAKQKTRRHWWVMMAILLAVAGGVWWLRSGEVLSPAGVITESKPKPLPQPPKPDAGLQTIMATWAKEHPEHQWSIVIRELKNGEKFADYQADKVYEAASIYKLFLTYLLFQKVDLGQISDVSVSSQGRSWPLDYCLDLALRISDNPCAWAIGNYTGWTSSNPVLTAAGFKSTQLDITNGHRSSALDTANLLEGLYKAQLYTPEARDYLLAILKKQLYNKGIPVGCSGCEVANKTGDLPSVRHDAAIVTYGDKTYLLVIFTDGATYAQIAELAGQIHTYLSRT